MKAMTEENSIKTVEGQLTDLIEAVRNLYYAAVWHPDRPVDEEDLWTAVRNAAGFKPGKSPKELPFDGIRIEYGIGRLRGIGTLVRRAKGNEFTTDQARAFLSLHGKELADKLDNTVREFVKDKLA